MKSDPTDIIKSWIDTARSQREDLLPNLWRLLDFIDGIPGRPSLAECRLILDNLKQTDEAQSIRDYINMLPTNRPVLTGSLPLAIAIFHGSKVPPGFYLHPINK